MQYVGFLSQQSLNYFIPVILIPLIFSLLFLLLRALHYGLYRHFGLPVQYLKRDHRHYRLTVEQLSRHPSLEVLSFWEWALVALFALGWVVVAPLLIFSSDSLIEAAKGLSSYSLELRRALWRLRILGTIVPLFVLLLWMLRLHPLAMWQLEGGNFSPRQLLLSFKIPFNQEQLRMLLWFNLVHLPGSYYAMLLGWYAHGYLLIYSVVILGLGAFVGVAIYYYQQKLVKLFKAGDHDVAVISLCHYLKARKASQGQAFEQLKAHLVRYNIANSADKEISFRQLLSYRYMIMSNVGLTRLLQKRYHYQIRLLWLVLWQLMGVYYLDNL